MATFLVNNVSRVLKTSPQKKNKLVKLFLQRIRFFMMKIGQSFK